MDVPKHNDLQAKSLAERVKELECLYKISQISGNFKTDLVKALTLILAEIPKGWQFPELMQTYLVYGNMEYGIKPKDEMYQSCSFEIHPNIKGCLFVYFEKDKEPNNGQKFLIEEQALLKQIVHEISGLIELDEKRKSERLIQEKLKHSDRLNLLGELTAGIAHELNTPLGNIIGFTELLLKDESDPNKISDLNRVLKSSKHASEIVKKLLFFSCEMPSQFKKSNLNKVIKDCIDLLKIQINEKQIQVNLNLNLEIPLFKFDAIQITQVIFNMVLNAIHAMDLQGQLSIVTKQENKNIVLIIQDNGTGIPQNDLEKIFQPFNSNKENGAGLGLAVTHGIVQAHKGRIKVESKEGEGTCFTIYLPITE